MFGIPDAEFGEALMAVVEPRPGATLDVADIRARLKASLADYKVPRHVEIRTELLSQNFELEREGRLDPDFIASSLSELTFWASLRNR